MKAVLSLSIAKKPLLFGFTIFIIVLTLTQYLTHLKYLINKDAERNEIIREVNAVKDRFKKALSYDLSATKTLAFIIKNYGVPDDFNNVAKEILNANKNIDALQLTRKGVITHVYPLKGNENVIGYDILKDSLKSREAYKAIEKNELYFAGPFKLKQGGMGIVGRLPIFKNNEFFGFSVVIVKLTTLLKTLGIDTLQNNHFIYQLSKVNPNTKEEEFFLPYSPRFKKSEFVSLNVADGEWNLCVVRKKDHGFFSVIVFSVVGIILSCISGLFAWYLAKQPKRLEALVKERTTELITSRNNYKTTLERVSDAFVALDKNWCYTFMNKKAGEIFNRDPEKMIGKNIWTEFPEGTGQPFYNAYYKAMEEQQNICLEEYYPLYKKWFENHIYPSGDGLTIYFKDITDRKKAEQDILQQRNFNQSIINSLPGIFYLYNQEGKFIQWNKNFEIVSGYSSGEISGMHPLVFFDEPEKAMLKEKIDIVFDKGIADVEAHLITKNKEKIPYYFSGHLSCFEGVNYLMGVGIDITERIRAENNLKETYDDIRRLNAHLHTIREEERTSIAREIHDELGQQLTGLKMDAAWLAKKIAVEEKALREKLAGMIVLIDDTVKTVRRISSDLRPGILDDLGLIAALEWQSSEFEKRTGIPCRFHTNLTDVHVEKNVATGIFRIYQETLTNAMRHANAKAIDTTLEESGGYIALTIKDNGVGFDMKAAKNKKTLGLTGMRERALMFGGKLNIESKPGQGTLVFITIPLTLFNSKTRI